MDTSSPENATLDETVKIRKLPYVRIKRALEQILTIALPLHIQILNEKSEKIEILKSRNSLVGLHAEQVEAAKYLKLLKADLYELEQLNSQVEDKDLDLFYNRIKLPIKEAVESITKFMELHPDALEPFPDLNEDPSIPEFTPVVCYPDQESEDKFDEYSSLPVVPLEVKATLTSTSATPNWSFLRKELLEVHGLIRHFASLVFSQKENVNSIKNNCEQAHENVHETVSNLKKASLLKAASFPIAGAVVGGIILGPVGALAGFKLLGTVACVASGGALGYKAGTTLKKKHAVSCDIEMKALTYPAKEKSTSNPDLPSSTENK